MNPVDFPQMRTYRWRWLAFIILTLRFNPTETRLVLRMWVQDKRRELGWWWRFGNGAKWRYRCESAWAGLPINWGKDSAAVTADEVPF